MFLHISLASIVAIFALNKVHASTVPEKPHQSQTNVQTRGIIWVDVDQIIDEELINAETRMEPEGRVDEALPIVHLRLEEGAQARTRPEVPSSAASEVPHQSQTSVQTRGTNSVDLDQSSDEELINAETRMEPEGFTRQQPIGKIKKPIFWKFIIDKLTDPGADYIIWENRNGLIFKILDATKFAQAWCRRKGKECNGSYLDLNTGRSFRFYQEQGILLKAGAKLTFEFVPNTDIVNYLNDAEKEGRVDEALPIVHQRLEECTSARTHPYRRNIPPRRTISPRSSEGGDSNSDDGDADAENESGADEDADTENESGADEALRPDDGTSARTRPIVRYIPPRRTISPRSSEGEEADAENESGADEALSIVPLRLDDGTSARTRPIVRYIPPRRTISPRNSDEEEAHQEDSTNSAFASAITRRIPPRGFFQERQTGSSSRVEDGRSNLLATAPLASDTEQIASVQDRPIAVHTSTQLSARIIAMPQQRIRSMYRGVIQQMPSRANYATTTSRHTEGSPPVVPQRHSAMTRSVLPKKVVVLYPPRITTTANPVEELRHAAEINTDSDGIPARELQAVSQLEEVPSGDPEAVGTSVEPGDLMQAEPQAKRPRTDGQGRPDLPDCDA